MPLLAAAQTPAELDKIIKSLDGAVFDAYNHCDLPKFASYFSDDVEFYHDQGGITLGKEKLVESVKNNICGKVTRELVASTLEIHPMKGIGAIEMGMHLFHHPDPKEAVGEGKFIHLWRYENGAWKITRVVSYDHRAHKSR